MQIKTSGWRLAAIILLGLVTTLQPLFSQATTGDILGSVSDSSGATLPGARVVIENLGTHESRSVETSNSGEFVFTP